MAENEKSTQNVEMETELLGSLFLKDGLVIPDVAAILKPNDFYYSVHQIIYQIILDFHSRGVVPSLISTWEEMQKHKDCKDNEKVFYNSLNFIRGADTTLRDKNFRQGQKSHKEK